MFFKYYSIYVKINFIVLSFRRLCLSKNYGSPPTYMNRFCDWLIIQYNNRIILNRTSQTLITFVLVSQSQNMFILGRYLLRTMLYLLLCCLSFNTGFTLYNAICITECTTVSVDLASLRHNYLHHLQYYFRTL